MDGDSGSWVVSQSDHKLCGYIFARVVGFQWAYMLPISPIIDDITRVAPRESDEPPLSVALISVAAIEDAMANGPPQKLDDEEKNQLAHISTQTGLQSEASAAIRGTTEKQTEALNASLVASTTSNLPGVHIVDISPDISPETLATAPRSTIVTSTTGNSSHTSQDNDTRSPPLSRPADSSEDRDQSQNPTLAMTRGRVAQRPRHIITSESTIDESSMPPLEPLDISLDLDHDLEPATTPANPRRHARWETRTWRVLINISTKFPRIHRQLRTHTKTYLTLLKYLLSSVVIAAMGTYGWLIYYCVTKSLPIYLKVLGIGAGFVALVLVWVIRDQILRFGHAYWLEHRFLGRDSDLSLETRADDLAAMLRDASNFLERRSIYRI